MIDSLITTLKQEFALTADEIADIFWLTLIKQQFTTGIPSSSESSQLPEPQIVDNDQKPKNVPLNTQQPNNNLALSSTVPQAGLFTGKSQSTSQPGTEPFKVPNSPSIRNSLALARSLRPLIQQVPSKYDATLDENKTAQKIAEERVWQTVTQPVLEPWLDLALVVEESTSMLIWQQTVLELQKLLRNYGAFRDVRTWGLSTNSEGKVGIRPGFGTMVTNQLRSPQELIDPSGRRLILLMTDCVASIWQTGKILPTLKLWTDENPTAILQMLPEWLWVRTALKQAAMAHFYAASPGVSNQQLSLIRRLTIEDAAANPQKTEVKIPVFSLEPAMIFAWSQMVAGKGNVIVPGYIFRLDRQPPIMPSKSVEPAIEPIPEQQLQRFRVASSPMARRLAALLAASPTISLPIIRLIQQTLLPKSRQVNVAEVLLGGILKPNKTPQIGKKPDEVEYHFLDPKIRSLLLESAPVPDTVRVLTDYIDKNFHKSLDDFIAELKIWIQSEDEATVEASRPFAIVTAEVLKRKGGRYSQFVREIEQKFGPVGLGASIIEDERVINLYPFEFEVATIELKQSGFFRRKTELIVNRRRQQSQYFIQDLGNKIALDMVQIPGGTFVMGAPKTEEASRDNERPQHQVTISSFYMGKYPVTQAQWQAVASLAQVNRELNPHPSEFKGKNLPVEQVSWYDAVEFCDRLSRQTGKPYRLPSEAEWEYACRAGTTTPFHFGETITTDLANYHGTDDKDRKWSGSYGRGPKGTYRQETTVVGSFEVANAFGLYDLHGNVWEWCADNWHGNYERAPIDGSAWVEPINENDNDYRLLRGGSWNNAPEVCRCSFRSSNNPGDYRDYVVGFRVVCGGAVARTL